jgi:integrase
VREPPPTIDGRLSNTSAGTSRLDCVSRRSHRSRIAGFVAWLCDDQTQKRLLSDATVRNIMPPFRTCLTTAVREGLIRSNPARDVDLPHRPTVEDLEDDEAKAMSRDELAEILALVPEQWHPFFWFPVATGVRISEAIALQWRHLELDAPVPHVKVRRALVKGRMGPPKSRYGRREIPLDPLSPRRFMSTTRLQSGPVTRTQYSQPPTDRRSCRTTSSGGYSNLLGRPQTFRGSAFTLSAIPAPRSFSRKAAMPFRSSAGSATTRPRSRSQPTSTCSTAISGSR